MRVAGTFYIGFCVLAALAAPLQFFFLRSGEFNDRYPKLVPNLPILGFFAMTILVVLVLPCGLLAGVRRAHQRIQRPVFRGLVTGLGIALWCNAAATCWDWMGIYPSTPVLMFFILAGSVPLVSGLQWAMLMLGNLVFWTGVCAAATAALQRTVPKPTVGDVP